MEPAGPFWKLQCRQQKGMPEDHDPELDAPIRGPLFPRPLFITLLVFFGVSLMLAMDWFGLLLLNVDGVQLEMGSLNMLRVTAGLMAGIAVPSALLMIYYRRLYSYVSDENVFFAITFSLSFMMGFPCGLAAIFG